MSAFFEDRRGFRYPVARIEFIGRSHEPTRTEGDKLRGIYPDARLYNVHLVDREDPLEVWDKEVTRIVKRKHYVPAQTGLSLITVYDANPADPSTSKDPIIAWAIDEDFIAEPVTPAGEWGGTPPWSGSVRHIIETSTGLVCPYGEGEWSDLADYFAERAKYAASAAIDEALAP